MNKKLSDRIDLVVTSLQYDANKNLRAGTDITIDAMELFTWKGQKTASVGWEQAKGNLFEYIEAAKLLRNNANAGHQGYDRFPVTDVPVAKGGFGGHTAPDDFRVMQNGKILWKAQAKVNNNPHNTAHNFVDPKYAGMQKITTSDTVEQVKAALEDKLRKHEISQAQFNETMANIRTGLTDDRTGISSGGTTTEELRQFCGKNGKVDTEAVIRYANTLKYQQMAYEIAGGTARGAAAGAVMGSVVAGVSNLYEAYNNKKSLKQALRDTGLATAKAAGRGAATGALSSGLRIAARTHGVGALANSNAAVTMAAGIVDCGVAVYSYAKGEITIGQLTEELGSTVVTSSSAYFFTNALQATGLVGSGMFLPMAVYCVASSMVMATREIIKNAKLNAQEYLRLARLYEEEQICLEQYRKRVVREMAQLRRQQKAVMQGFLRSFDEAAFKNNNYSQAVYTLVALSNEWGYRLNYTDFNDFSRAMLEDNEILI